jgi:hypothetical protein
LAILIPLLTIMNNNSLLDYVEEQLPEWESEEYFMVNEQDWVSEVQKTFLKIKRKPIKKGLVFVLERLFWFNNCWISCDDFITKSEKEVLERFETEKNIFKFYSSHKGLAFGHRYWWTHYKGELLDKVIFIDKSKYVYLRNNCEVK